MKKPKARIKIPRYVRWIAWALLVQFILINISAALYAYKLTHVSDDPGLRNHVSSPNVLVKTWRLFSGPRQPKSVITEKPVFPFDTVKLKTSNGLMIDAWYSKPDSAARGTVILFHGVTLSKSNMIVETADFRFQGYNVMMVDFRAHGNSDGYTTTLGVNEAEETKLAYDYVVATGEKNIFLWGSSMGAVAVARAVSKFELKPSGVILEMPFESLQTYLQGKARALGFPGFPEKPFGFFVSWWIGVERGFGGWKHRTTKYVKNIQCPVLMQWGSRDEYVSSGQTNRVYAAIASQKKELVIYENAGHESLLQNEPLKWRSVTEKFLTTNDK